MPQKQRGGKRVVGWREWVALPGLGIPAIQAKVDTGARTSSLHAFEMKVVRRGGRRYVRFKVHPLQRDAVTTVEAKAEVVEKRNVKSSIGGVQRRCVIVTELEIAGECFPIEINLTARDQMGFRMLLGREALRSRFLVDPGRSFVGNRRRPHV